ncbi:MAG TPA: phosphoribosylformylglycinamidine synthase subunit PurL [Candidatus Omnitrophota bacterium]|nr:phosphoribosylformylglycinamidine synthase subunit PurL [Candidatus Omnitrophota bacterium]HPD84356.1 phosphoribosylformylglycinamidine synthase subunit PurL [Candidatus Omnitrophota bacterium]HRZ03214.1 phosphoribosylformylglycinamidine synthase subunit PurL [Candidatus Omnitrophota bacterium]
MIWRVEIKDKEGIFDALGAGVEKDILDLGVKSVSKVRVIQVYTIEGDITQAQVQRICEELLIDKVIQDYSYGPAGKIPVSTKSEDFKVAEIAYNPGVMDPVEESTLKGIRDLGIEKVDSVRTAKKYLLFGNLSDQEFEIIVNKTLSNKLIQHAVDYSHADKKKTAPDFNGTQADIVRVSLRSAGDKELLKLSQKGQLFLSIGEMRAIKKYFQKIGKDPTDCELETIAQTWSEHCVHKTFRGNIRFHYFENGKKKARLINNLLKSTIVKATKTLNKSWCLSVFHDNAGVIKFDDKDCVCFKVETHNHPSALEPFGGANTGIGGVIRDILGTGLGARPICNTDIFCFAPPDFPFEKLPQGALHPKRIMKGVVSGVRDYGNKMGIPTVNGAILFDERFVGNPLVYCGTVGIMPNDKVKKAVCKNDLVVVVGGRTGRDGIHGATFSSGELTHESEVVSSGAVQIGNPIQEKKVLDALMQARDKNLYSAITDCGAGGLSSAVGEMGKDLGARIDLEKVPLKYKGLSYKEIWISESQERMVLSVHKSKIDSLLKVFNDENVEATVIGEFTGTGYLELFFSGRPVCSLDMKFLHDGLPRLTKEAVWAQPKHKEAHFSCPADLTDSLKRALSHYNVCSKEWVIRQYDHEVQGAGVVKSLTGVDCEGPSDASVLRPKLNSSKGIAISNGINIRFGMIDPFWMSASCIDEAVRQIIAVGGSLKQIAILDNFCWGNPDKADRLGSLVRASEGCLAASLGYKVPFISGKDSLYNEYAVNPSTTLGAGGKSLAIPGTILISAIGILDDVNRAVTMDFKKEGSLVYIIGETSDELGGSIYFDNNGLVGNSVPKVDFKKGTKIFETVSKAAQKGLLAACHDCSEGGLAVTLAEMAFSGGLGATVFLKEVICKLKAQSSRLKALRNDFILFSESNSRFVVEVERKNQKDFEKLFKGIPLGLIGCTQEQKKITIYGLDGKACLSADTDSLKESWQKPLRW